MLLLLLVVCVCNFFLCEYRYESAMASIQLIKDNFSYLLYAQSISLRPYFQFNIQSTYIHLVLIINTWKTKILWGFLIPSFLSYQIQIHHLLLPPFLSLPLPLKFKFFLLDPVVLEITKWILPLQNSDPWPPSSDKWN